MDTWIDVSLLRDLKFSAEGNNSVNDGVIFWRGVVSYLYSIWRSIPVNRKNVQELSRVRGIESETPARASNTWAVSWDLRNTNKERSWSVCGLTKTRCFSQSLSHKPVLPFGVRLAWNPAQTLGECLRTSWIPIQRGPEVFVAWVRQSDPQATNWDCLRKLNC
jgi:hypothetical protein